MNRKITMTWETGDGQIIDLTRDVPMLIHANVADALPQTIDVSGDGLYEHIVGDADCTSGWCGSGHPVRCRCGGLIHADFGDENSDGDYWLYEKCDRCGHDFRPE